MSRITAQNVGSVFKVNTSTGTGTGFYLKERNLLVTNFHVVQGHRAVAVEDQGQERYLAQVVFVNPTTDLAFLQPAHAFNIPPNQLSTFAPALERERVYVLGYPFGMPYTETEGIVSSPRQLMGGRYYIQTDAAINPGNSGGPMVNSGGQLVGITTSKFTDAENVGFAIPVNDLQEDIESFNLNEDKTFAVKCNSCKNLVFAKTDYCTNCGNSFDSSVFNQITPNEAAKFVEQALTERGLDPVLARSGEDYWNFYYENSMITVYFHERNYLYAFSPLNELPPTNLENLLKYILATPLPSFKLGIFDNKIYLYYRLHMSDIFSSNAGDVRKELSLFPQKAEEMSRYFLKEFGSPLTNYSKPQKAGASPEEMKQQARDYSNQALRLKEAGQYAEALGLYQKELQIYETLDQPKELAVCWENLVKLYLKWGKLKDALASLGKEEEIHKKLNHQAGLAGVWWRRGVVYGQGKDYRSLVKCWQYAIRLYRLAGISTQKHEAELQKISMKLPDSGL